MGHHHWLDLSVIGNHKMIVQCLQMIVEMAERNNTSNTMSIRML